MSGRRQLLNHALFCFCFFLCCYGWALAIGHQMSIGRTGDRDLPSIIIFFSSLVIVTITIIIIIIGSRQAANTRAFRRKKCHYLFFVTIQVSPFSLQDRIRRDPVTTGFFVFVFVLFFYECVALHGDEIYGTGRVGGRVGLLTGLDH